MISQKHDDSGIDLVSQVDDALMKCWWNAKTSTKFCEECDLEPNKANREKVRRAIREVEQDSEEVVGSCGNGYFISH